MAEETLSARLVEIESMLDRSRRRFEEGSRLVEEAHALLGEIQQALIGSPRTVSPEDSEEAASKLLASLKASRSASPRWNIACSSCSRSRATMSSPGRCC
jgi:two-component system cell cycle response regulator CtrA